MNYRSNIFGEDYAYFGGLSKVSGTSVLPPQAIPKANKNEKWEKVILDNLEKEGLRQYTDNLWMMDYYKMLSGEMSYIDLTDEDKDLLYKYVGDAKKKLNLPDYIQHWDLMYPVVSKITGEWALQGDKFRFDTTDEVSANDYIRERTHRLMQYSIANFKSQMNKILALDGIEIKEEFNSEEEYQQYQQLLDKIQKEYYPDRINDDMKNFKTLAADWAEKTWDRDYERFKMHLLESLEARDILLTGKSIRHYRIGYDHYYPEYWHPIETFHSKDDSLTRIEDAEFAGRIKFYTVSELMNTHGFRLSEKERDSIYKSFFGNNYKNSNFSNTGNSEKVTSILGEGYFERMLVPFKGYSDHMLATEWESATGIPRSERIDLITGETRTEFSDPFYNNNYLNHSSRIVQSLRTDYSIRLDTIQTTEVYWKGSKKIGLLSYRTINGYITTTQVDEDLLPEVIEEYGIKNLKSVSLIEYEILSEDDKENTIIWIDVPIVYRGLKINVGGLMNGKDIYNVEIMPVQIKGDKGRLFDVKLPICGHIGESFCKKIKPEQITYNYLLNQNQGYLEKEIGAFFVIDVNSLPMEFFDLGDGSDALVEIRNIAKTTGLLPTDLSRNNLNQNGGGLMFNPMTYNNATFTDQLTRNLQMAERYKWMAYEKLGITPSSMGNPSQYSTAEGIQVSQNASYAQMYNIDQVLMENKRSNIEIHMRISQYCQLNNKDVNYIYMASDNEIEFLQSIKDDPDFDLRQIDVRPTYNAKKNREFQQLKQILITNNTMGHDALSLTELALSDDFLELKDAARRAREFFEKMQKEKIESDQSIEKMKVDADMKKHNDTIQVQKERNIATVKSAQLRAMGQLGDNTDEQNGMDLIQQSGDMFLKQKELDAKSINEYNQIRKDLTIAAQNVSLKAQEIGLKKEKLAIEREKLVNQKYVADSQKYIATVNKN